MREERSAKERERRRRLGREAQSHFSPGSTLKTKTLLTTLTFVMPYRIRTFKIFCALKAAAEKVKTGS